MIKNQKRRIVGHFFTVGDQYYGFDDEDIIAVNLDQSAYNYIYGLQQGSISPNQEYDDYCSDLVDLDIIFKSQPEEKYRMVDPKKVGRVSFPTVHDCNFGCKYCFASSGANFVCDEKHMTSEMLLEIMDYLYYGIFAEYETIRFDFVSGGEPLLNFPIIQKLNDLTKIYNLKTGKTSFIWVCTNGSLLSSEILEYFEREHIGLGISYEGTAHYQNSMRPYRDGRGSYDIVSKNIANIMTSEYLTAFTKKFWTLGVITAKTQSIVELVKAYEAQGIANLQLKLCRLPTESEYSIRSSNIGNIKRLYQEFSDYLKQQLMQGKTNALLMILNKNDLFGKYILRIMLREPLIRRCGAGVNKISICSNGDIYPCDSFVGNSMFLIGNIKEKPAISGQLDHEKTIYTSSTCSTCWARHVCGGDCFHNAYVSTGKVDQPLSYFCELYKYLIELAIDINWFITEIDPRTRRIIEMGATIRNEHF